MNNWPWGPDDPFRDIILEQQRLEEEISNISNKETPIYEAGTWVPTLSGAGTAGTFTYTATERGGEYTRFGRRIWFNGRVRITVITVNPVGALRITGLPFAAATPTNFTLSGGATVHDYQGFTLPAGYTQVGMRILAGTQLINIVRSGSNIARADMVGADMALVGGVFDLTFSGHYRM